MKIIRYGLMLVSDNSLLGFSETSNDGCDDCTSISFELEKHPYDGKLWLVESFKQAEFVRNNSTKWYNAGYSSPINRFKPEELKVVELEIEMKCDF